jgi:hypothetical protein
MREEISCPVISVSSSILSFISSSEITEDSRFWISSLFEFSWIKESKELS